MAVSKIMLMAAILAVLLSVALAQYGGYGLNFGFGGGQGSYGADFGQGYERRNGYGYNNYGNGFGNGYGGYPGGNGYQQYGYYGR